MDAFGRVYVIDSVIGQCRGIVRRITPGTRPLQDEVVIGCPGLPQWRDASMFAVDAGGTIYSTGGNRVWKTTIDGQSSLLAGADTSGNVDGRGGDARFDGPTAVEVGADGTPTSTDAAGSA